MDPVPADSSSVPPRISHLSVANSPKRRLRHNKGLRSGENNHSCCLFNCPPPPTSEKCIN